MGEKYEKINILGFTVFQNKTRPRDNNGGRGLM
jgi:hypothetical protein